MGIFSKIFSHDNKSNKKSRKNTGRDWWENEGKDSEGWTPDVDDNDPDRKALSYREKDWED